jgi:hypothetical protein
MAIKINATTVIDNSRNITGVTVTGTTFAGEFPSGTLALFGSTAAPTGWTKSTTHNDKTLRVVSGAASSGGSVAFSTVHSSKSISASLGATSIDSSTMGSHGHDVTMTSGNSTLIIQNWGGDGIYYGWADNVGDSGNDARAARLIEQGSGGTHTHTFSGTAIDFSVGYIDLIIATRN